MYRCMGCMADLQQNTGACPHCGYVAGTAPAEAYHLGAGTILQGRYIVGRVLGYGGFGVTYIGWDAELERIVAIKEYLPSTFATRMPGDTEITVFEGQATEQYGFGLERFVDEAQRLAQFNGIPGIVDIYDTFSSNKTAYIVMEFLQGRDVKQILAANGPLPYEQAREIVGKVCEALEPVHAKGIIHRDISPDNIYITAGGEVRLLDFGAARYESSVNSKSLSVILKSGYAPEEQYRSKGEQGSWTDVYALAATMYKMLTGVTPNDSMERAIQDELKEPSKLGAEIPESAENALMNALNIRKNDRTQTVGEFSRALGADEVERVKVKQGRVDSGRIPTWGKVLLGGGLGLVLLFALLVSTGVVGFGEGGVTVLPGNQLSDDYGGAVAEGMVMVPNLLGMSEIEAAEALAEAGLEYESGGYAFSSGLVGAVGAQNPGAGQQVQPGETVAGYIGIGKLEETNQSLALLKGMDIYEVLGMAAGSGYNYNIELLYTFSSEAPGALHGIEFGNYCAYFLVSAGQESDAHNNFDIKSSEMRAPVLYAQRYVDVNRGLIAAVANSISMYYEQGRMLVSADGTDWHTLAEIENMHFSDNDFMYDQTGVANTSYMFDYDVFVPLVTGGAEGFEGETLRLRLEAMGYDNAAGTEEEVWQSIDFAQTVTFNYTGETILADVEVITWEEVVKNYEDGVWGEGHRLAENYAYYGDLEELKGYVPLRISGDFAGEDETYYSIFSEYSTSSGLQVYDDGCLYAYIYFPDWAEEDVIWMTVLAEDWRGVTAEDGMHIEVSGPRPTRFWFDGNSETAGLA